MSYAAFKGHTIDAVLYVGFLDGGYVYPDWFNEEVLLRCRYIESDGALFANLPKEEGEHQTYEFLSPHETVLFRNRYLEIQAVNRFEFNKYYYPVGPDSAALHEDCVEYYIFQYETDNRPPWVKRLFDTGHIIRTDYNTFVFYGEPEGEYAMSPTSILIRNKDGDVRYLEPKTFYENFETYNPYAFK